MSFQHECWQSCNSKIQYRPTKSWSYFIVVVSFCFFCAYLFQLQHLPFNYPLLPANHIDIKVNISISN
jgi:hypothetical protein